MTATGRPLDQRSDLYAMGIVFFEMLTGRQLFTGETVSDVLAAVLRAEPDWAHERAAPESPAKGKAGSGAGALDAGDAEEPIAPEALLDALEDGHLLVPDRPGWGTEPVEEATISYQKLILGAQQTYLKIQLKDLKISRAKFGLLKDMLFLVFPEVPTIQKDFLIQLTPDEFARASVGI